MNLTAVLPRWPNRGAPGTLLVKDDDGHLIHQCSVLGKADGQKATDNGNPNRNPLLPFGDTPAGVWACHKGAITAPSSTYGKWPVIHLAPVSGNALKASTRSGIWLHGGAAGTAAVYGFLRPTFGCLRIADDDMRQIWLLAATFGEPETLEVKER